jgi:hypothetical protein
MKVNMVDAIFYHNFMHNDSENIQESNCYSNYMNSRIFFNKESTE